MNNLKEWENCYRSKGFRHKNKWPDVEVISFIMRNWGNVRDKRKIRILELGCGWGNNLRLFKEEGFSYCGIDFSRTAVNHCNRIYGNAIEGDIEELSFDPDCFDCVIDRMAIQHNPKEKIKRIIQEIFRILKPGGKWLSVLAEKDNFHFLTSYLTKSMIRRYTNKYKSISIKTIKYYDNKGEMARHNVVVALK